MRRLLGFLVSALLGAAVLAGCTDFKISSPKKEESPAAAGRYTIASPQKEIFLLDTATGKTWLLIYEEEVPRWRPVHMEGEESVPPESKAPESKAPESKPPGSKAAESKPPAGKTPEKPPAPKNNTAVDNAAKSPPRSS